MYMWVCMCMDMIPSSRTPGRYDLCICGFTCVRTESRIRAHVADTSAHVYIDVYIHTYVDLGKYV